jgi:Tfp pilus assembly major pilin PilA
MASVPPPLPLADESARAALPVPPSMHWGVVLLFSIFTFGIFGMVWPFIQARWIRRIDHRSNAVTLLGIAIPCYVAGYVLDVGSALYSFKVDSVAGARMSSLGGMLLLGWLVLFLIAYFGMADSIRKRLKPVGLSVDISGAALFFFNLYYLQGQLRWLAHWKNTGEKTPAAPKGVFWAAFLILPIAIAALVAIATPAFRDHFVRQQVAEGANLAVGAKIAMAAYYEAHHALPADNAAAGLPSSTSITGRYVSSVNVAAGVVTVTFDGSRANRSLRYHTLVFLPVIAGGKFGWDCSAYSTLSASVLPPSCRR